jgi:alkanesulfonate monooxygenase SsuD/methylene tetrahydromethanopterin reductase-like flavin-dependent oxidoreductase (luciferase family)
MRFGIFYEHQLPRPWEEGAEQRLFEDALEQIEVADRVGFDYVWEVEHHFMEEYSHSSAPEVFLAAASQRTRNIRLGHGIVNITPAVNHPARVAERIATLDLVSGGRVEFGTGEASSAAELGGFGVRREHKRAMWEDAMDAIAHMLVEEPFAGWHSDHLRMPPRNVVPKPVQRPHPPLWVACSRRETIHFAARNGIGALSFSFVEPEDAGKWVDEYYEILASEECRPVGFAVNPNFSVVLPMMCHEDERTAIERGIDGAHFFGYALAHYYGITPHEPAQTSVWDEFIERRETEGFARDLILADKAPLGVKILQQGLGSLRGAVGTPDQITDLVRRYEAVGVDQIGFVLQAGRNKHEHIRESLELFGERVIPQFAEERDDRERAKAQRLAPAVEAALARRSPARRAPARYRIDEPAEVERARRRTLPPPARLARAMRSEVRRTARRRGERALGRVVGALSDSQLELLMGWPLPRWVLFEAMALSFRPRMAFGFEGEIQYEITTGSNGRAPDRWTIAISDGRARARRGAARDAAVTLRIGIVDLLALAAGANPGAALIDGRASVAGDLNVAMRLPEMFGAPSPY